MSIVEISAEEANRPYLHGGEYGPGLKNEADVSLTKFEFPAESRTPGWWESQGKPALAWFGFEIVTPDGTKHFVDHFVRKDGLRKTLLAVGAEIAETASGGFQFDPSQVAGRKIAGLVLKDAREYQGVMYTGDVRTVVASS